MGEQDVMYNPADGYSLPTEHEKSNAMKKNRCVLVVDLADKPAAAMGYGAVAAMATQKDTS